MEPAAPPQVVDLAEPIAAPREPTPPAPAIIKKGWLTKEGAFVKSWKLNWFELSTKQVTYYTDEDIDKRLERGYFMLGDVESIRYCPRKYDKTQCLAVATPTRTWYLRGSPQDLSDWLKALSASIKALRYTTTITIVVKDVHLLTLVIRDTALGTGPEKVAKKDKKHIEKIDKLSLNELLQSEYLFTHQRLAVARICQTNFASPADGGAALLALCEYCWTRETREVPRVFLVALLGLGVDFMPAQRFYESTDWVKEHKAVTHYSNSAQFKTTTTTIDANGESVTTTVIREGRGPVESTIWSSQTKKKHCAPETWAMIEDHPRWRA